MKFLVALLFSVYIVTATQAAPLLHLGNEIQSHESSSASGMDMQSQAAPSILSLSDVISRCLRVAAFFTTAIPSSPLALTLSIVALLLCGIALHYRNTMFNVMGGWNFTEFWRRERDSISNCAVEPFRTWLALLELSPNFIAASSG